MRKEIIIFSSGTNFSFKIYDKMTFVFNLYKMFNVKFYVYLSLLYVHCSDNRFVKICTIHYVSLVTVILENYLPTYI